MTTVEIPKRDLGREAVQMLVQLLKGGSALKSREKKLPVKLVLRQSVREVVSERRQYAGRLRHNSGTDRG